MYEIQNLNYKTILNIKELTIDKQINIVTGPSGSGKTTLINLLRGLDFKYQGSIKLSGQEIKEYDFHKIQAKLVAVPQESILLSDTIAAEFSEISHLLKIKVDEKRIKKALQICEIEMDLATPIQKLSGGQKQRLYLARAIYTDKELVILDEPTSALDKETTSRVFNNLKEYIKKNDRTIIIISHDQLLINDHESNVIDLGEYNGN